MYFVHPWTFHKITSHEIEFIYFAVMFFICELYK